MLTKIKILPPELVNKIAAGEVVERPVSVVKELVENSIDAEATEISIEIKSGGLKYIRVVDNGCGMDKEDVELAFTHHATSKISSFEELNRILTLGFRGEALPSIALVSQVEVVTKPRSFSPSPLSSPIKGEEDAARTAPTNSPSPVSSPLRAAKDLSAIEGEDKSRDAWPCVSTDKGISQYAPTVGTEIKVEGGKIKSIKEVGAPEGTSITVRELFYNTPARRKFLKSPNSETRQIIERITTFALAFPQISFKLKVDGKETLNLQKADSLKQRIGQIFGSQILKQILELDCDYDVVQIKGFLGKPEIAKTSRAEVYLFVNQRSIFSKSLYHALLTGYKDLLPKGKFPWGIVCLSLPPDMVDVNVHPAKKEVRFSNEKQMYEFLYLAVYKTLNTGLVMPIYTDMKEKLMTTDKEGAYGNTPLQVKEGSPEYLTERDKVQSFQQEFLAEVFKGMKVSPLKEKKTEESAAGVANLWQLSNMYILAQVKGSLVVMDQHAAHERVLYEEAVRNLTVEKASSQHLLFPIVTELSPSEFMTFEENNELINKLGFEVKPFGGRSVLISGVPPLPKIQNGEVFLREILVDLEERLKAGGEKVKSVAASFACKGAIKAGDKLSLEEMNSLFDQLFATKEPYSCPHGRPTLIRIPIEELNKRFERT